MTIPASELSVYYAGNHRTANGRERRRAYVRARERARTRVAALHREEYEAIAAPLRAGHPSTSREYSAAQAAAKRSIAARHPQDFARLLDEQLAAERLSR